MSNSLVYRPGAGNRRYWRGIRTGALSAVALIVLVSLLHPSSFNGTALHTSEATATTLAAPSRSTTIALTSDETRLVVVNREANSVSIIQVKDANGNDVAIQAGRDRGRPGAPLRGGPPERPGGVCHQRHQRHRLGR